MTVSQRVAGVDRWYHTLDLGQGVTTPGWFDLRGAVGRLPWPDVEGRRCLDVATFDGFYAFEMERRGAAEVVAIDIDDIADIDWLPRRVPRHYTRGDYRIGEGFALAAEVFGSTVRRVTCNVYDLSTDDLGTFDVVVCGALLEHLRDPLGALGTVRSVCRGTLLSVEHVDLLSSLLWSHSASLRLVGHDHTWMLPNVRGHRRMLVQAGFDIEAATVLGIPFGPGHHATGSGPGVWVRRTARRLGRRLLAGTTHPVFSAVRSRPAPGLHSPAP